jgi:double-stranded uracil-DNA glycosylase
MALRKDRVTGEHRPSPRELREARGRTLPDLIAPGLRVLFCGINPGLYSGAVGHHFARPGNRFWPALHAAGFTPRLLHPSEEGELPALGYGFTNIVNRATPGSDDLTREELVEGGLVLRKKVRAYQPCVVAFLGIEAYRIAFGKPKAMPGKQEEHMEGALVWVLPSPSGLNAHYRFPELVRIFRELKDEADGLDEKRPGT